MNREELWKAGRDETVEVNQRALIDKILARYSGENTIFRELLQNADDAGAQHVQVKFYSKAGLERHDKGEGQSTLPDVKSDSMYRYVVTNDGIPFRPEDWARLKKIAEGNPDESKIGAFGVGFYSLWSCCDDPFVESGGKWMGFYWKDGKDQLMARSGDLPPASTPAPTAATLSGNPLTSFTMNLRDPSVLEGPLDLARFLITSLTFMRTIRKIDMLVDDVPVLEVEKSVKGKEKVWKRGMRETSSGGMMKVKGVEETGMRISVKVMRWLSDSGFIPSALPVPIQNLVKPTKAFASFISSSFFGRASPTPSAPAPPPVPTIPTNPKEITTLHRDIQVYQAEIGVTVSSTFAKELERATKKAPPKLMPASLIFAQAEEAQAVVDDGNETVGRDVGGVFAGLCPPLDGEKSAKVFIGQATSQTTGIGGHLAARFIPTVERESIDLVDKHVSHWNRELLWIGGFLSRLIYELESAKLQTAWIKAGSDVAARTKIAAQALHALRFFTFNPTTPSSVVGQEMEMAFFQCATDNKAFPLIANTGILPIDQIRMPKAELEKFLPELPTLTSETLQTASRSIARLRERGMLRDITFDDVVRQLAARPLNEVEMTAALQWWQGIADEHGYTQQVRARLIDAAVLIMDSGKVIPLSMVQTVIRPQSSSIPTDMPLPPQTIPYTITKDLKGSSIYSTFGWTELTLAEYITFLVKPPMSNGPGVDPETDLRTSPAFAEKVLSMLGRAWQSVSNGHQIAIALELKDVPCIPTKAGFKKPGEAYFEKNLLFDDLPIIAFTKAGPIKGGMEKMLLAIGVRKTVDLQLVFSRLIGGGTWTCQDLMKYLVSVKDTLTTDELAKLRQTAAFPEERPAGADGVKPATVRRKPMQLYEPTQAMRDLGLPVLDWGEGKWKSNSEEAKMLYGLGLRRFPPPDVLLGIAAGPAPTNEKALNYLLANTATHYVNFDPSSFAQVAFIPATRKDGQTFLAKPGEVFTNWDCAILGFAVADPSIATPENAAKLRISTDPPMEALIAALVGSLTTDTDKAKKIFEYLAGRMGTSGLGALERLQNTPFIPVKTEKDFKVYRPTEVYFSGKGGDNPLYKTAFTFVDFGEKANAFLRYCGVRSEPSVKDVAKLLMRDPERMLRQAGSPDKYLEQLRLLAANWDNFDRDTRTEMRFARFLLASQRVPTKRSGKGFNKDGTNWEDEYERDWVLCQASEVAVVDDITFLQYFGKHILAAPEEQLLETFYQHLGAKALTTLIHVEYIPHGPAPTPSAESSILRKHVLERLTIFLAEAKRRQNEYTPERLAKEGGFAVQDVKSLEARYTYKNGRQVYPHTETLYAMAQKQKGRGIVLTVSLTAIPDDYDIASALCSVLLRAPKADDALLLYSILTTPLMALKKRGFNVDRMLNQQREERLRLQAEAVRDRERYSAAAAAEAKWSAEDAKASSMIPWPASDRSAAGNDGSSIKSEESQMAAGADAAATKAKFWDRLKGRRSGSVSDKGVSGLTMPGGMPGMGGMGDNAAGGSGAAGAAAHGEGGGLGERFGAMMEGMRGAAGGVGGGGLGGGRGGASTKRPTDMNSIRSTVQKALDASRPETSTHIQDSRMGAGEVSESQSDYCDTTASADIVLAVDPGPAALKLWIPRGVENRELYLKDKMAICQRFAAEILMPIARVFKLANPVLNVFWDHEGPLIAFNRGGAVFCNARYFSAWHNNECLAGRRNEAFISWYFSIAHELAHNLESAHNSAHEFYFSSIAEEYLVRFVSLLSTNSIPTGTLI